MNDIVVTKKTMDTNLIRFCELNDEPYKTFVIGSLDPNAPRYGFRMDKVTGEVFWGGCNSRIDINKIKNAVPHWCRSGLVEIMFGSSPNTEDGKANFYLASKGDTEFFFIGKPEPGKPNWGFWRNKSGDNKAVFCGTTTFDFEKVEKTWTVPDWPRSRILRILIEKRKALDEAEDKKREEDAKRENPPISVESENMKKEWRDEMDRIQEESERIVNEVALRQEELCRTLCRSVDALTLQIKASTEILSRLLRPKVAQEVEVQEAGEPPKE